MIMQNSALDRLRTWLTADSPYLAIATATGVAICTGLVTGALFGFLGPVLALGAIGGLVVGMLMLRSTDWGLYALIGLICLLPYGAMPIEIGFRPTFIDAVLLALFGVWFIRMVTRTDRTFQTSALGIPVLAFLLWALITFIVGLSHAPISATVLRRFAEVLLAVSLFFMTINQVRTIQSLKRITGIIIAAGGLAGFLGVLFYVLPGDWTVRILSRLAAFNYPTGTGILRYVEDDPSQPMRAIATSIDPNALGGLLVILTSIAIVQLFAASPVLPRRWLAPPAGLMGLSLMLTFSRGSMLGLAAALALVGVLRYRKLLVLLVLAGIVLLLLPQTQVYVTRFLEGIRGEDLATQMRFGEYKDALILISRYPLLGVGFSGTPDIDLYLGVSMLYLLIAEQMGLVGLLIFLIIIANYFAITRRAWRRIPRGHILEGLLLAYQAALAGALVSGIFDHFFFNINFVHLVALFWLVIGLGVAAAQLAGELEGAEVRPQ
ncbi:MAG: O-antigen ligase family protein [Anaerolineae bacterium]